jgi:hypothetical protein
MQITLNYTNNVYIKGRSAGSTADTALEQIIVVSSSQKKKKVLMRSKKKKILVSMKKLEKLNSIIKYVYIIINLLTLKSKGEQVNENNSS